MTRPLAFDGAPQPPNVATPMRTEIELSVAPTLCFAMEQSGVPLVHAAAVRFLGPGVLQGAELTLELQPDLSEPRRIPLPPLLPGESHHVGTIDVRLPAGRLRQVTETERSQLVWTIRTPDAEIARGTSDVEVLPFNHWPGGRAPWLLLASFVTPNHAVVAQILRRAADRLGEATGSRSLDGYQSRDPARARAMVRALYEEIASLQIAYAEMPAGFEQFGQKVRLPDQLLSEQLGCCLDLALLFASCLEQMGLAPLLIVIDGHAFPAVWLLDERFPEALVEDVARLRTQIDLGQLLVFESTTVTGAGNFDGAIAAGGRHLQGGDDFRWALDVRASRGEYRPLPLRGVGVVVEEGEAPTPQRIEIVRILSDAKDAPEELEQQEPIPDDVASRFQRWKDRLLDLTLRNKLLNFRPDRKEALPLRVPDLGTFEDLLATGSTLELVGRPSLRGPDDRAEKLARNRIDDEEDHARLVRDLAGRVVHSTLESDRLDRQAVELIRAAKTDLEEGGATTLFVAVGILKWREQGNGKERLAPLLLYPAELSFDRKRRRVQLRRIGQEEAVANVTLIEKLRRDFAIDLSQLAGLEQDDAGLDVKGLLDGVRRAIQAHAGFEVLEEAHVARLSFSKFLMWKDLEDNAHQLLENPVVRHIAGGSGIWADPVGDVDPAGLDQSVAPHALPSVMDADSTQLAAVVAALRGRSFVLQGPPGTGKSQTITNLVAAAVAEGKSVLFVSEKMAALEVVHRRLQSVGLGDFCLELHSNKANKKDVLLSLGAALDRKSRTHVPQWEGESERLAGMRQRLNAYAAALHAPRPAGFSVYEASARLRDLLDTPEVRIPIEGAAGLAAQRVRALHDAAAALADRGALVEPWQNHPWRHAEKAAWRAAEEETLADAIDRTIEAAARTERAATDLESTLGLSAPHSIAALGQLADVGSAAAAGEIPEAVASDRWDELSARAHAWLGADAALQKEKAALEPRWQPSLLEAELAPLSARFDKWAGAFFLFAFFFLWGARKQLARHGRGKLPPSPAIRDDLTKALAAQKESVRLEAERAQVGALLQPALLARGTSVRRATLLPRETLHALVQRSQAMGDDRRARIAAEVAVLRDALGALQEGESTTRSIATIPDGAFGLSDDPAQLGRLHADFQAMRAARGRYREACLYREAAQALRELDHDALVVDFESGRIAARQVAAALERNLLVRFLAAATDEEPALRSFDGNSQDRLVRDFAELDRHHLELSRAWVIAKAEDRLPPPNVPSAAGGEMLVLRREIAKQRQQMAVRRLLQNLPELLPRLKPCLLMSPISVAQYLPPTARFDMVVFDEASQIGTHDAIGAIARGNQVVVVGDSRQLPPTAFFQRASDDDDALPDENDVAELESVLEEAQARGLPQQMLGWHYRSRHDSLIDFSNRHYYDGRLSVFPAARQVVDDLGVKWHPVPDGVFLSGGERTNPVEAKALVEHLVAELKRRTAEERTFGVVTFSLSQRRLIEDLIDEARAAHPEIEPHFQSEEPVFVKNLENVQGDERDEILFSIGYAGDEQGRLRMQFGPLSSTGGERRLNVAITRARCQLRVFSTLRPEDIDLARTRSVGAAHLKAFLQSAARGAATRTVGSPTAFESRFHREIHDALAAAGYRVGTAIGCAGYRVDLAVERPGQPGVYALGIELDGPRWASAETARDRERLRREVLGSLGWRMVRVWTPEWTRDPQTQTNRILQELEKALADAPAEPVRPPVRQVVVQDVAAAAGPLIEVWKRIPPKVLGQPDEIHAVPEKVRKRVAAIVAFEGPIHVAEVAERVAEAWQVRRIGSRISRLVDDQIAALIAAGAIVRRDEFLWPKDADPARHARIRAREADGGTRDIERLPPEEIACAASWVSKANGSLSAEELGREVARLLGVGRVTERHVGAVLRSLAPPRA